MPSYIVLLSLYIYPRLYLRFIAASVSSLPSRFVSVSFLSLLSASFVTSIHLFTSFIPSPSFIISVRLRTVVVPSLFVYVVQCVSLQRRLFANLFPQKVLRKARALLKGLPEPLVAAIVRVIHNLGLAILPAGVLAKEHDARARVGAAALQAGEVGEVGAVHSEDEVELVKVGGGKLDH